MAPPLPRPSLRQRLKKFLLTGWFLPYPAGLRLQRFIMSRPLVQKKIFPRQVRLVQTWAELCDCPNVPDVVLASLMSNTWRYWRAAQFRRPQVAARWLTVEGIEHLTRASARGGVLLVVVHTVRAFGLKRIIHQHLQKSLHPFYGRLAVKEAELILANYARQLVDLQKALQNGEIVTIGGDGLHGRTSIDVPFFGRRFPFRTGFSELALRNSAAVVPLFTYFDTSGRFTVEFCPALQTPSGSGQEAIEQMVRQYTALLTDRWSRLIASMNWNRLRKILAMPALES